MNASTFMIVGFKLPFSVLLFVEQIVGKFYFNTLRNTWLFDARQDWPFSLPISFKIGKSKACKFDLEVDYFN